MAETRRGLRLAKESLANVATKRELGRQQLHRDAPLEPEVACTVDDRHAAATDLAVDLIGRRQRPREPFRQLVIRI